MSNDYFTESGDPVAQSRGVSSLIRALFTAIGDGFDKLAGLTGNGGKLLRINSGATAQEAMSLGTANQVLGMNSGATGYEHKTVAGTANEVTVTHGAGTVTASLPTALTFTGKTVTGGTFNSPTISSPSITGGAFTGMTDIAVADGGTGSSTAAGARTNLGVAIGIDVQAYDADLDAVAGLSATGLISRTGAGTASARTITAPAAGISVSNGDGVSGNPTLALANDLAAVEGLSSNGLATRTSDGNWTTRSIAAGTGCSVSNGDGVSGNPTISLVPGIGLGDVLGPGVAVDGEIALYDGITGQVIKRASTTGILRATSGVLAAAVAGTDYLAPPSGTALLKANSGGALANAVSGTDYCPATSGSSILKASGGGTTAIVSGTDIKTVNNISLLGSGNIDAKVANVVTATTATTLTNTPTLLQITPTGYGVRVTLPDATTCTEGGPLHIIDNKGAYPVMVDNSAGTLLGFVYGGVVSHVSLIDNSMAAGVWSVENSELVGASAQLLTTSLTALSTTSPGGRGSIALDSDREFLLGHRSSDGYVTGVVYRKSTNAFGAVAVIRAANVGSSSLMCGVLQTTNQVLVVSCTSGSTAFEAVVCSVDSGTDAITPGTAATATLSGNITTFADGCGLIQVGTSFITSYTLDTPACQIREITVSGTTPTVSAATVLSGTAGGLIVAGDATHVIAVSTATTHLYTKPYTIGGLAAGTGTDTAPSGSITLDKFFALGTRWGVLYRDGGANVGYGGVVSLSGTTTSISVATLSSAVGGAFEAIVVGSNKVLALTNQTTNNANILTDTAGTASAGTAITLSSNSERSCLYVSGTDVYVREGTTSLSIATVDCSSTSPVLSKLVSMNYQPQYPASSNAVLGRSAQAAYASNAAHVLYQDEGATSQYLQVISGRINLPLKRLQGLGTNFYRGVSDTQRWVSESSKSLTKLECVV